MLERSNVCRCQLRTHFPPLDKAGRRRRLASLDSVGELQDRSTKRLQRALNGQSKARRLKPAPFVTHLRPEIPGGVPAGTPPFENAVRVWVFKPNLRVATCCLPRKSRFALSSSCMQPNGVMQN